MQKRFVAPKGHFLSWDPHMQGACNGACLKQRLLNYIHVLYIYYRSNLTFACQSLQLINGSYRNASAFMGHFFLCCQVTANNQHDRLQMQYYRRNFRNL